MSAEGRQRAGLALLAFLLASFALQSAAQQAPDVSRPPPSAARVPDMPLPPRLPGPPKGITPLATDMFTSKNFYKDRKSWSDPRYYRCNTPREIVESLWESGRIGATPPTSASWGDCKENFPRSSMVSPYPYKSAKEHYEALLAAARARGGPTRYSKGDTPDWDGFYERDVTATDTPNHTAADWAELLAQGSLLTGERWQWGGIEQVPTVLSLLTPEYQKRYVQMLYHEGVDNSHQWNAQFCYPEGLTRWWAWPSRADQFQLIVNWYQLTFLSGVADNFVREFLIGRTEHVQKVPQWYGETLSFWDGTTLIAWTANVQAWTQHTLFENSGRLEVIEIFKPTTYANGRFSGLDEEVVFYDPEALVQPVRFFDRFVRRSKPDGNPAERFTFIECLSNIRNVAGHPKQLTDGDPGFIDYYGRPWAKFWEENFEKGWDKPSANQGLDDVLNSLDPR